MSSLTFLALVENQKNGCFVKDLFLWVILAVTCFGETPTADKPLCPQGEYGVISSDGSPNCRPCSSLATCPAGMGMSTLVLCGDVIPKDTNIHCVDCVLGKTYSSKHDGSLCQPCHSTTCYPNVAFDGKCTTVSDTTRCTGNCKKAFYPRNGSMEDCQPCSPCLGQKAKRVLKCVSDGMPSGMQCEVTNLILSTISTTTEDQDQQGGDTTDKGEGSDKGKSTENDKRDNENGDGYKVYGHPGVLSAFVIIISFLGTCLLVITWKKKCKRKKTSTSDSSENPEEMPLSSSATEAEPCRTGVIVDIGETDIFDDSIKDVPVPSAMRRRTNSSSSGGKRKVSFSRQNSNSESDMAEEVNRKVSFTGQHSNSGSELTTEENAQAGNSKKDMSEAVSSGNESSASSQVLGKIKRTLSLGSERKVPSFTRQISNPIPEPNESKGFPKSKTFGSFSSIRSSQKGTSEETTPFLASEENDDDEVVMMKQPTGNNNLPKHKTKTVNVSQLNAGVYLVVCRKLNQDNYKNDWRTLAGKMGYSSEFVKDFEREKDPTDALLTHWGTKSGNDVTKLIELLTKMERSDIVSELESEQL